MKVTIEFGHSRVVVPFTNEQTVKQLMLQAAERYQKLLSKPCKVQKLETRCGALLCGDDLLGDVIEDKDKLVAVFNDFDDDLEDEDTIEEFSMSSKKEAPFNHPRLAGDASLGLSPIHQQHPVRRRHIKDEPATSSPMTSLLTPSEKIIPLNVNPQPFQRGGKNRSTTSRLSSDAELVKSEPGDDEGFCSSDAQRNEYYSHSILLSLRGGTSDIGVKLTEWPELGLRVEKVESGSIADMEEYFVEGDGILEIDDIKLNNGTFSYRSNIFEERTQRSKFVVRVVTRDKIEEIESLDSRKSVSTCASGGFHSLQSALKDVTNSRKMGRVLKVAVTKQPTGLGFTVTSRDTAGAGESPILINRITPDGAAAASDLAIGDRLLAINDRPVGSEPQSVVVSWLKSIQPGETVQLKVSRVATQPLVLAQVERHSLEVATGGPKKELGLQLKTEKHAPGLFVEHIVKHGAAEQDGRLRVNDQILSICGKELTGLANHEALNVVRRILQSDSVQSAPTIALTIGRSASSLQTPTLNQKADSSRHNDSYIIATKNGIEKIPLDPKMNRSQSLKALQYIQSHQTPDESVTYKAKIQELYSLESENEAETTLFDRESTSRQSFSEKRKQVSSMSPPMAGKLIEYRSLTRKKNGVSALVRLLRGCRLAKRRWPSMHRLRQHNISRSHPDISSIEKDEDDPGELRPLLEHSGQISLPDTKSKKRNDSFRRAITPKEPSKGQPGQTHQPQRRAISLERRHSGGSTGVNSRSTEVTDSFSSTSQHSSQNDSRTYKDQIGRFSPRTAGSRSTSLSPTKCPYPLSGSRSALSTTNSPGSSISIKHHLHSQLPARGAPMRSRSSDRVTQARHKTQDNQKKQQHKPVIRGASADRRPSQLSEEDERKYDQIRARTLEYRRMRDSKIDAKKKVPLHQHQQQAATAPPPGGKSASGRRGSFGNCDATRFRATTDHLINTERFSSLSRLTRRKYHSPGTVSCQDFHPAPTPVTTKPYFTPDSQTLPYKERNTPGVTMNRRLNYESQPQHHLSTPFISRSENI